jgi:hypothetical protein
MNVKSVAALWNDQTSSVVSSLKNSSDPTVSMFSKLLEGMMTNDASTAATSLGADASIAAGAFCKPTAVNAPQSATAAAGSAQKASNTWVSKMADHFRQTEEMGSSKTLLPDLNASAQTTGGSITTS